MHITFLVLGQDTFYQVPMLLQGLINRTLLFCVIYFCKCECLFVTSLLREDISEVKIAGNASLMEIRQSRNGQITEVFSQTQTVAMMLETADPVI